MFSHRFEMFRHRFQTNVTNPLVCLWSRVWVYVAPKKQKSDHPVCEQTEKLTVPRSQRRVFSHRIKQELHLIEIRQDAEMSQFVVVENQPLVS